MWHKKSNIYWQQIQNLVGKIYLRGFVFVFFIGIVLQCTEEPIETVPTFFPSLSIPSDNPPIAASIELGKLLFYDKALSLDSSIACATCHKPHLAFSDNRALSLGVNDSIGTRNSPTLTNVGYNTHFFKDGGVQDLETQAMTPIQNKREMALLLKAAAKRFKPNEVYQTLSQKAYNRPISPYSIVHALAAFQRTLISSDSPYDRYFYKNDKKALNEMQIKGMKLFFSEQTHCSHCHSGFNFTNFQFENNGLYKTFKDRGREMISLKASDRGKFKVPTLRNIELTAPYMHDGSVETLEDVLQHYNKGGQGAINQSPYIRPLNLSIQEQRALIAFLKTLTDTTFIHNPKYQVQ